MSLELFLPLLIFGLTVYLLSSGRRTRAVTFGRTDGAFDFSTGRRVGDTDLETLKRAYTRFAEEREGRRLDRAPYEGPRVAYLFRGARAVLSLHVVLRDDGPEERFTQLAYAVPAGWRHRIEIGPLSVDVPTESAVPGLFRVSTGESAFDAKTRVIASDVAVARTVLDEQTRAAVADLRGLLANGHVHLSASSSRILFRKRGVLHEAADLSLFARLCDTVYDRLLRVWERENGIEILESPPDPDEGDPRCQVCTYPMAPDARVQCRRCRTPHHPDCWDFNGGCATFACGEKHSLKGVA